MFVEENETIAVTTGRTEEGRIAVREIWLETLGARLVRTSG